LGARDVTEKEGKQREASEFSKYCNTNLEIFTVISVFSSYGTNKQKKKRKETLSGLAATDQQAVTRRMVTNLFVTRV
jgi:uncharacterized protein YifE (UPF0438 family)